MTQVSWAEWEQLDKPPVVAIVESVSPAAYLADARRHWWVEYGKGSITYDDHLSNERIRQLQATYGPATMPPTKGDLNGST